MEPLRSQLPSADNLTVRDERVDTEVGVNGTTRRRARDLPSDTPGNVVVLPVHRVEGSPGVRSSTNSTAELGLRARALTPIDPPLAFVLFLSGVLLIGAARALEPVPTDHVGIPLWLLAIDTFVWAGVCSAGIGLVKFKTFGLWGATLAGVALLVESAVCVLTGHHAFGLWWVGQMACSAAFLAGSLMATRINARASASR